MPLDSESRWRLVRRAKTVEQDPVGETAIRPVRIDDLSQIVEIYNYYVRNSVVTFDIEPLTLADWRDKHDYIAGLNMPFLVAISPRGELLGFAYVAPWRQKAAYRRTVENSIYLRPAATGKRVGTRLLEALIAECKERGIKEIVAVISDKGAEPSIKLHEAFGFKSQGHLGKVGFKFGRWLGVVLLQKSL